MPRNKKQKNTQTRIITTNNTVRVEAPQSRTRHKPKVSVVVSPDEFVGGFVGFLREHAIVGLAVGFVIGTQVQTVVKQIINSFVDPAFQLLFGQDLSKASFALHFHGRVAAFGWGGFAYTMLDFLFVLLVVYIVIRLLKLENFDKPQQ